MNPFIADSLGLMGVACLFTAYFLLQTEKLTSHGYRYLGLNLAASVLLLISLIQTPNFPSIVIQIAWGLISTYGLVKAWRKQ